MTFCCKKVSLRRSLFSRLRPLRLKTHDRMSPLALELELELVMLMGEGKVESVDEEEDDDEGRESRLWRWCGRQVACG